MAANLRKLNMGHLLLVGILLLACVGLEYYLHRVLGVTDAYSHLFYIPLFIAAFWWGFPGGLLVGLFLGATHTLSYLPHITEAVLATSLAFVLIGSTTGVIGSERKQAERKLQKAYEKEAELRRDLEIQMKRRVEFTRALVHELKTPITPILASSDLLVTELREEPFLSLAKNINRGACAMNDRVDELLDLARGEIGMLQLKLQSMDLLPLLRTTADDMAAIASSQGQSLLLDLPSSLPVAQADGNRLRQIVLNLLSNACKFTPTGGKITLKARKEAAYLVIEVEDTGPGISEEEQQRLFQPYYRLESNRERFSGLGLGLALCKTLVELQGGKIWVKSQKGKGSTFSFSIPLETKNLPEKSIKNEGENYEGLNH